MQGDNSTTEDQEKQKQTASRWTSLTKGREDHYDLESKVGDQRLQRERQTVRQTETETERDRELSLCLSLSLSA